jgi:mitogen-activated protein kinase organizer 1
MGSGTGKYPLPRRARFVLRDPHVGPLLCAIFNATGEYILSGGQDRTVQLWSADKGTHIRQYSGPHGREVRTLALSPSGSSFASAGGDRGVFLWDVVAGECTRRLRGHDATGVNALAYAPADGGLLASAGYDQSVRLWDVRAHARDPVQCMTDARDAVTALVIHETSIYAASMDGCVRKYDVREASKTTDHIAAPISSMSLSHDGNCLLLSCLDSVLRLMDVGTGQLLNEYVGAPAKSFRMSACFERSDALVTSGGEDGLIRAWDLVEGKQVAHFEGHEGAVTTVAWHPRQDAFVSTGVDGTMRVWK